MIFTNGGSCSTNLLETFESWIKDTVWMLFSWIFKKAFDTVKYQKEDYCKRVLRMEQTAKYYVG